MPVKIVLTRKEAEARLLEYLSRRISGSTNKQIEKDLREESDGVVDCLIFGTDKGVN